MLKVNSLTCNVPHTSISLIHKLLYFVLHGKMHISHSCFYVTSAWVWISLPHRLCMAETDTGTQRPLPKPCVSTRSLTYMSPNSFKKLLCLFAGSPKFHEVGNDSLAQTQNWSTVGREQTFCMPCVFWTASFSALRFWGWLWECIP